MAMTHEHDQDRETASAPSTERDDPRAPGRASRSAQLQAPRQPLISGIVQRKARDEAGVTADADHAVASASTSAGVALPSPLLRKFEASLGTDLSNVRVHTGGASETAANAVGARAFAIGQDIHFAAGQFDPANGAGEHLIAHEVAHTVQQRGGATMRQNKLAVSSPGDAAEYEADRAADAMISGARAHVASAGGVIHRDKDPNVKPTPQVDDKTWATDARARVEAFQAAIAGTTTALNTDAAGAVVAFRTARTTCDTYEKQFNGAKSNFTSHIKEALEKQKELEEMLKQTFEVALAAGSLGGAELAELVETTQNLLIVIGTVQKLSGVTAAAKKPGASGDPAPSPVDWKGLLDQVLGTLNSYTQQSSGLASLANACTASDHWLTTVVEGHGPNNARQTTEGIAAGKLAVGVAQAQGMLAPLGGSLAAPASRFAAGINTDLTQRGLGQPRTIEQNIAVRWIALQPTAANGTTTTGFGGRGSAEIHASREYLEQLGVLGKGSRTGVDTGSWDSDYDDDMAVARARVEASVMRLVGTTGEWQGGKIDGANATGEVVAGEERWKAVGKAAQQDPSMGMATPGLGANAGGNVRILSYSIAPISEDADHAPMSMKPALLHDLVTLTVQAVGATGGGAVGIVPTISQGQTAGGGE